MSTTVDTWYERLRDFLFSKGFIMGKVDNSLFTKKIGKDLFVLQIYVDDIIFGSTNQDFCEDRVWKDDG